MASERFLCIESIMSCVSLLNKKRNKMETETLTGKVIGCAIEVHRALGPGLLESTYQQCLAHELNLNNIPFKLEHPIPVNYKGILLDCGYRVEGSRKSS